MRFSLVIVAVKTILHDCNKNRRDLPALYDKAQFIKFNAKQ